MADEAANRAAFEVQARYCDANDAPITAALCRALGAELDRATATGRRVLDWASHPVKDALVLRLVGGVHALWRDGRAPELAAVFEGGEAPIGHTVAANDAELVGWLDGPPQTNEPGRSAALMAGMLTLAAHHRRPLEIFEIGSSAGLNLLIDRFRFELGDVRVGPEGAAVTIAPAWRGPPPPAADIRIETVRGVDIAPIDPTDADAERRLLAYVWADHPQRFDRVAAAIDMIRAEPVRLEWGDAADWVEARLVEPHREGVMRVLMHSIVWQYLPPESQARIETVMAAAGERATSERPLGWVSLEADRTLNRHDLTVRSWPGHSEPALLAHAHAHGFWIEWLGEELADR